MAHIKYHCADCKHFIGDEMIEVHKFLDYYTKIFPPSLYVDYHRTFLHNSYGLNLAGLKWGKKGYLAALIHLTRDYVGAPIDHWSLKKIIKDFAKYRMWFDLLRTEYKPRPSVMYAWNNKSIVSIAFANEIIG